MPAGALAESVERTPPVRESGSLRLGRVKPMTYKIDTYHYLAWHSALIEYGKNWLAQYQDNVNE